MSLHISKCNQILKTRNTDCVSIAVIHHLAIFHIALGNPKIYILSRHLIHLLIVEYHPDQSPPPFE